MATNTNLPKENIDFETIRSSLKEYLSAQDTFVDYNFEGSGLSILLDVLAYNTHHMAYYANMVANEAFLDSAVTRNAVVSKAKEIGYVPGSIKSATVNVDVEFASGDPSDSVVSSGNAYVVRGDVFATSIAGKTYRFVATNNTKIVSENGKNVAKNVELKEGTVSVYSYTVNTSDSLQKFILPSNLIDTDSLVIRVQRSISDTTGVSDTWALNSDYNIIDSNTRVYFLQETDGGYYQLYFGDGIVGKALENGNVIYVEYRTTTGPEANGAGRNDSATSRTFTYPKRPTSKVTVTVDTDGVPVGAFGGKSPESIASIKYYAPKSYQAQDRAVTAEDYRVLLASQYSEIAESVYVWGGEDNDPPIYGKVFISIKPKNSLKLSQLDKLAIARNILKSKNVVTILPEIIDPEYVYLVLNTVVKYDPSRTSTDSTGIAALVRNAIAVYSANELEKFDRNFRFSKFSTGIDDADVSILSNSTFVQLRKSFEPILGKSASYVVAFDNEILHPDEGYTPVLSSTSFGYQDSTVSGTPTVDAFLDDDGYGNVRIYKLSGTEKVYLNDSVGTVDYTTGKINLISFKPETLDSDTNEISITVTPTNPDVLSRRNLIISIDLNDVTITAEQETLRYDPFSASASPFPFRT